jgi:hypothetical protein
VAAGIGTWMARMAPVAALAAVACTADVLRPSLSDTTAWVPFQGEFRAVAGGVESRGRFMRHSDGSTRRETFARDQVPAFVTIVNVRTSEFHSFSAGGWTSQPLAAGRREPPTGSAFPNAMPQADRVAGYRVVRADTALGSVMLRAPVLNYFALVEDHPDPPLRLEFLSVTEDVPAGTVFEPPAGAPVARLPWPHDAGR